jgi:hypothetical protein
MALLALLLPALLSLLAPPAAGAAAAASVCSTCRGPKFSWDTVPAFIHTSNKTGPVNQGALELMAKFPMVVSAAPHHVLQPARPELSRWPLHG